MLKNKLLKFILKSKQITNKVDICTQPVERDFSLLFNGSYVINHLIKPFYLIKDQSLHVAYSMIDTVGRTSQTNNKQGKNYSEKIYIEELSTETEIKTKYFDLGFNEYEAQDIVSLLEKHGYIITPNQCIASQTHRAFFIRMFENRQFETFFHLNIHSSLILSHVD